LLLLQGAPATAAAAGSVDVMASMDFGSSLVIDFDNQADPDATVRLCMPHVLHLVAPWPPQLLLPGSC
jgi:hypothetical protein